MNMHRRLAIIAKSNFLYASALYNNTSLLSHTVATARTQRAGPRIHIHFYRIATPRLVQSQLMQYYLLEIYDNTHYAGPTCVLDRSAHSNLHQCLPPRLRLRSHRSNYHPLAPHRGCQSSYRSQVEKYPQKCQMVALLLLVGSL
jgi:hypothetical protein